MISNGTLVSVFNVLGKIVGKTEEGRYIINLETGNVTILALTQFSLM